MKIYETEQHIPVRILLDRSESMDCEGADESKFLYAQRLAATFAYLALLHLDTAAVVPFADRLNKPLVVSGGRVTACGRCWNSWANNPAGAAPICLDRSRNSWAILLPVES